MLISVQQLHDRLPDDRLVIIDCRFTLVKPSQGREAYEQAHIPGACYFDLELDLSGPVREHGGRHPLPDRAELARKLGAAGIGPGAQVVVYDGGRDGMAARAWWLIRYLGHDNVSILDGGLQAWVTAGYETTSDVPEVRPATFLLQPHDKWVVSTQTVEDIVNGSISAILIDARSGERYRGEVEPLDKRAGHIPGALNLPFMEGFTEDGHWKNSEAQQKRFQEVNALGNDKEVVMYCGSGVTACNLLFALELAGVYGAKLYSGSWSDWCSYSEHPVETGTKS